MDVSKNIRDARTAKGITQADIARQLGVERTNYHRLENRGNKLTIEQAESIAEALEITLLNLLTWGEQTDTTSVPVDDSQLRKRIDELEDRLKDKDKVIQHVELEFNSLGQSVMIYIWDRIERQAIKKEIGIVILYFSNPNREIQIETRDYIEIDKSKNSNKLYEGYYKHSIELTESQLREIFYEELQDEAFRELVNHFYLMGYIAKGRLHSIYVEYKNLP